MRWAPLSCLLGFTLFLTSSVLAQNVEILDDEVSDAGETVKIRLSEAHVCGDAARTINISSSIATGTIWNTDPIPAGSFSVSDAEATEGVDAALDFTVTLGQAQSEAVTVDHATSDGTATAPRRSRSA